MLVVAPHGGRRFGAASVALHPRKVNDLHTADFALQLAEQLNGSLLANTQLDRNETDLNRISQVVQRAPWFLVLLGDLLADILQRHAIAEVLFVHGWNVIQPKCDIGIGMALDGEDGVATHGAALTVTPRYVGERLRLFRQLCAEAEVETAYGERYPGSHPNNLIQLFRRHAAPPPGVPARLAEWAEHDRVQAIQLELGVPLRWPGGRRDGFVAAATRAFSGAPAAPASSGRRNALYSPPLPTAPAALQFYDPRSDIGLMSSVTRESGGTLSGRLLLSLGSQRIALFVGDERRGDRLRGGPQFSPASSGFRLEFDGALLETADGKLYIDLEQAFAASRLCHATVDLVYAPTTGPTYGAVEGRIRFEDREWRVAVPAFAGAGVLARTASALASHTALSVAFAPDLGISAQTASARDSGTVTCFTNEGAHRQPLRALAVDLAVADRYTPERLTLRLAGDDRIFAEPRTCVSISRPLGHGRAARITFGTARCTWGADRSGFGFYEYGRRVVPGTPAA